MFVSKTLTCSMLNIVSKLVSSREFFKFSLTTAAEYIVCKDNKYGNSEVATK